MVSTNLKQLIVAAALASVSAGPAIAEVYVSPYLSIRSTKTIDPSKKAGQEDEKIKQYKEAGVTGGIGFWRLFRTSLSLGQATVTSTEKKSAVKDEYDEIDYNKDMNMSTDNPDNEIKITETQRRATFSLQIDPSFWIFIMRAKLGVTAQQRIVETREEGLPTQTLTKGPTYKPLSGLGLGVRLTPSMYFMVEYSAYHYKFPKMEPFERQLTVNYCVSI